MAGQSAEGEAVGLYHHAAAQNVLLRKGLLMGQQVAAQNKTVVFDDDGSLVAGSVAVAAQDNLEVEGGMKHSAGSGLQFVQNILRRYS